MTLEMIRKRCGVAGVAVVLGVVALAWPPEPVPDANPDWTASWISLRTAPGVVVNAAGGKEVTLQWHRPVAEDAARLLVGVTRPRFKDERLINSASSSASPLDSTVMTSLSAAMEQESDPTADAPGRRSWLEGGDDRDGKVGERASRNGRSSRPERRGQRGWLSTAVRADRRMEEVPGRIGDSAWRDAWSGDAARGSDSGRGADREWTPRADGAGSSSAGADRGWWSGSTTEEEPR